MPRKLYISTLVLLGVLFMTVPVMGQVTYSDTFSSVSYSNNDGTLNFSGDWVETNETTDPSADRIQINSNQLRFRNLDTRYITRDLDLSAATSATLTLDYDRTSGNESVLVQLWDGSTYNTIATLAGTGSINYNLAANEMSASSSIRFRSGSGGWGGTETLFVDNVLFTAVIGPAISIDNITVDEDDGTATFTATHVGVDASGPFTVNYQTADISATAGSDYTAIVGGVLSFNGTVGDTEQIVVSISDDILFESDETYRIELTGSSDPSVSIGSTGTGTISDNEITFGNTPLALFEELDGYMDYTGTAGTFRTQPDAVDPCAITTSSSGTLTSAIPAGATIERAYLYWAHSANTLDSQVTFEGTTVNAQIAYTTNRFGLNFHGMVSDVTSLVSSIPDPSTNVYDVTDLNIDNTGSYCSTTVVLGGWSLIVFYSHPSLPASTINLYQGFDGNQYETSTFTLSGFYAIGSAGAKTTSLSWEGDQNRTGSESLEFTTPLAGTNELVGDGDNDGTTVDNPFNSTLYDNTAAPVVNNTSVYGVDMDTYDVSAYILPGETSATTEVNVGIDYVINNVVVLKVPSNLITGRIFEDVSYGGGVGRNYATSSGVPVSGATVELYDNGGTLVDTQTSDASGIYVFAGMVDGTYGVRVVNETVTSTRPGGGACGSCLPIQTFKTEYIASTITERTNEVGGADPTASDPSVGILTGAQSVASVTISSEGVAGLDFGYNFNTIVNTNASGQGSLDQFIINSNGLGEAGLDIEANAIFDPAAGEDTSVFMIPPTGDALGRTTDPNYSSGVFAISISSGNLSAITGTATHIDSRTQTAYSGDTNSGTIGSGGTNVGTSATALPNYNLPEIQVYRPDGDVLINDGTNTLIRNLAIFANNNSGVVLNSGSITLNQNLLGVNAAGVNGGDIVRGISINDGTSTISDNYISTNVDAGIWIDGGALTVIQNNHITANGDGPCDDNIQVISGSGISIQQNLIEAATGLGIETDGYSGGLTINENTITTSGQDGTTCSGDIENAGIRLHGDNSSITNNIIASNGGAGIVLAGGDTSGNLISQNSIYANGTATDALGIDIDNSNGVGDGVTLNENGDTDNGPNGSLNFPIVTAAYMAGGNLVIKGWARPGATIEVFLTDVNEGTATAGDNELGLSTDYGEGQIYLGTVIEGSGADLDAGSSTYTDVDGNTDNTNRFHISFAVPPTVAMGDMVTATATLGNSTSEFSPMSVLKVQSVITNRRITYRVNQD